ncbi:hypothetical protein MNBD_GAMMA13-1801 [hydrothermal vent metagenome]|uniref:Flavodoxin-like fold domain-containing protein n=1 Tax=hydrothermal vent metagenome TaxID=652676 RepID=A0A3B0YS18_9ZZZZ
MSKRALVIDAHQKWEGFAEGRLNNDMAALTGRIMKTCGYEVRNSTVEQGYDPAEELDKTQWADVLVIHAPVFWFGVPGLFKTYIDEVYTAGLGRLWESDGRSSTDASKRYGSGGLSEGRQYMICTTWNAPKEVFSDPAQFFDGKTVDEVLIGLHKLYQFMGMTRLSGYHCHDVLKNPQIEQDFAAYTALLKNTFCDD